MSVQQVPLVSASLVTKRIFWKCNQLLGLPVNATVPHVLKTETDTTLSTQQFRYDLSNTQSQTKFPSSNLYANLDFIFPTCYSTNFQISLLTSTLLIQVESPKTKFQKTENSKKLQIILLQKVKPSEDHKSTVHSQPSQSEIKLTSRVPRTSSLM